MKKNLEKRKFRKMKWILITLLIFLSSITIVSKVVHSATIATQSSHEQLPKDKKCYAYELILGNAKKIYKEVATKHYLMNDELMIILLESKNSWTLVALHPSGRACVLLDGVYKGFKI